MKLSYKRLKRVNFWTDFRRKKFQWKLIKSHLNQLQNSYPLHNHYGIQDGMDSTKNASPHSRCAGFSSFIGFISSESLQNKNISEKVFFSYILFSQILATKSTYNANVWRPWRKMKKRMEKNMMNDFYLNEKQTNKQSSFVNHKRWR